MRTKRLYVVPEDSYLSTYATHWNWVRHSLGKQRDNSADAWVALRTAQDKYWIDDHSHSWNGAPWVRNLERWLVQKDVGSDGVSRSDSSKVKTATIDLPHAFFDNQMANAADFRIFNGGQEDLEVRFVRLIRKHRPAVTLLFQDSFEDPVK